MKQKLIHLIADYGVGDPAFAEVSQKLLLLNPDIYVMPTSVPPFSTLATGFWVAQLSLVNPIPGMLVYANTAPRKDDRRARDKNEGEGLLLAELKNGVKIIAVNAGYCFSFVKTHIKQVNLVNVANKGSQFRSRDFYPEAVVSIARNETQILGQELDKSSIPDVPSFRIAWIDGYGNMKTTVRKSQLKYGPGTLLKVSLNEISRPAYFSDGTFLVQEGELAFAPGSSGGNDRFLEIFLRGLSAWHEFGKPKVETEFSVEET